MGEAARSEIAFSERSEILGIANRPSVKHPYVCLENMLRVSRVLKAKIGVSENSIFMLMVFNASTQVVSAIVCG